jgi:hypothetical protein
MTSPADPDGTDLSGLKGRRKSRAHPRRPAMPTLDTVELPPLPDAHETMADALRRPAGLPALHPLERTRLVVVETGGHVPAANLTGNYVVAEFDGTEQHTPWGCRTPISRVLWNKGQHVRRDVYATYLAEHPELAADANEMPDGGEGDTSGGEDRTGTDGGPDTSADEGGVEEVGVATTTPPAAV